MERYIKKVFKLDEGQPWVRLKPNPKYDPRTIDEIPKEQLKKVMKGGVHTGEYKKKTGTDAKMVRDFDAEDEVIASGEIDAQINIMKHLRITKGRGKLKNINSLNTDARDNPNCMRLHKMEEMICYNCFSITGLEGGNRGSAASKKINSKLLTREVHPIGSFPSSNGGGITPFFRISSDGDFINSNHVKNVANFLKQHFDNGKIKFCAIWSKIPKYTHEFTSYAREIDLDLSRISLIFSTYKINDMNPKIPSGFDKCFTVYSADFIKQLEEEGKISSEKDFINCGARNCLGCKRCYQKGGEKYISEKVK